jgi:hypothetical protein
MDSEKQHRVLLRHYKRLGMVPVRDITEDIACVPGTRHLVYPCSLRMALPPPAMQHVVQLTIGCTLPRIARSHDLGGNRDAYGSRNRAASAAQCGGVAPHAQAESDFELELREQFTC